MTARTFAILYYLEASDEFYPYSGDRPVQECDSLRVILVSVCHTISLTGSWGGHLSPSAASAFPPTAANRTNLLEQNLPGLSAFRLELSANFGCARAEPCRVYCPRHRGDAQPSSPSHPALPRQGGWMSRPCCPDHHTSSKWPLLLSFGAEEEPSFFGPTFGALPSSDLVDENQGRRARPGLFTL